MKYLALLSGGKDSCYNLLHCEQNGHQLVAAASLGPENGKEELDSYLYQTVGQDAIEFVAEALDVPLYRRIISGAAVEQGSEYGGRTGTDTGGVAGDETEDLYHLLSEVKSHHPDLQGVSVGAILSNYQRVRVEHVCRRLSLTPLCYLWQRDQADLLSEMIDAGMNVILIKVAGIGLKPQHLGRTLSQMQPTLIKLNELYGSHICGEGGEYESLTVDCPLFKKRINITEMDTVIHADNDFATVAYLRIKNAILERKDEDYDEDIYVPPLLEDDLLGVRDAILLSQESSSSTPLDRQYDTSEELDLIESSSKTLESWFAVSNIHCDTQYLASERTVEDEAIECFRILEEQLAQHKLTLPQCTNINLYISSMDLFSRVNNVYAIFFGVSPPARATVAVDLSPNIHIKLDAVAYREEKAIDRQALHVQGLSYWAPANIGPYSQAITVNERIFISGQIGLIPSNLTLPSPASLAIETSLSCQHVERVTQALNSNSGGGWAGHAQLVIYWLADPLDALHVRKASETYAQDYAAPTLFVAVQALPKGALIEKQVLWHTGRCQIAEEDDDEPTWQSRVPFTDRGDIVDDNGTVHWEISCFQDSAASCAIIVVRGSELDLAAKLKSVKILERFWTRSLSVRLFYQPSLVYSPVKSLRRLFEANNMPPVTPVPSRFISSRNSDDWDYAISIIGN